MGDKLDPDIPSYSIGTVQKKTSLSARQIRYYEAEGLIKPARSEGNQRLYSKNDVTELERIKKLMDQGINLAGIKKLNDLETEDK